MEYVILIILLGLAVTFAVRIFRKQLLEGCSCKGNCRSCITTDNKKAETLCESMKENKGNNK